MSWKKYSIGDFLIRSKQAVKIQPQENYSLVTIRMYHKGVVKRSEVKGSSIKSPALYKIKSGQFILSGIDARNGAFGIVPEELTDAVVTNDFWTHSIDTSIIDIDFFYWFTTTSKFYEACIKASEGTTNRQRLQADKFYSFDVWLPSIAEQKSWANKITIINAKCDVLNQELNQQQSYLGLLRQTILQEAVQGKLTKQNPADEPASELLKRIKAEKQKLTKEGKLKKEKELPPITDDEIPFALPEGWVWCRLGELILKSEAGKSLVCERREAIHPEWGIIKVSAMSWGKFDEKENKVLPTNVSPTLEYKINEGDYLISRANTEELIGKSVIVGDLNSNLLLSDKSIRLVFSEQVSKSYLKFYNDTNFAREYYKRVASGTSDSMKNITREQMYHLPIPLPSYPIQNHIVEKVESFFHHITQLEQQVTTSQTQARQLLQAVLAEAFEAKEKVYEVNEELSLAAEK